MRSSRGSGGNPATIGFGVHPRCSVPTQSKTRRKKPRTSLSVGLGCGAQYRAVTIAPKHDRRSPRHYTNRPVQIETAQETSKCFGGGRAQLEERRCETKETYKRVRQANSRSFPKHLQAFVVVIPRSAKSEFAPHAKRQKARTNCSSSGRVKELAGPRCLLRLFFSDRRFSSLRAARTKMRLENVAFFVLLSFFPLDVVRVSFMNEDTVFARGSNVRTRMCPQ